MKNQMLDLYTDYLLSQNQQASATGLSDLLENQISHDKITRFLRFETFGPRELWLEIKKDIRAAQTPAGGVLIVDDSIEEKPYTDESELICWHYSHAKSRHVKGINLLTCMIRYGDISFPMNYETVRKNILYCDLETKKERRKADVTKNEMFRAMLKQACKNQVLFDHILADNWFGSKENMSFIHRDLKKNFIIGIKSNRLAALSGEAYKKGQYQTVKSLDLKDSDSCKVWLKDLNIPLQLVKKVFKNENGSTGTLYLVTNDFSIDDDQIYKIYQKRWRIEEYHKSIKQNASLAKSPTKIIKTQLNHLFSSLIAYCKLERMKIKTTMNHFAIRQKLFIRANQIAFLELRKLQDKLFAHA